MFSRNVALTLRAFWQRRIQFAELISTNSSLNVSRYIRLMLLALFNMTLTIPISVFGIYLNSHGIQLFPWISWENVHYNFSRVEFVPSVIWRSIPAFNTSVELTRWLFPVSAFLFFALFGFASEAQKQYRSLFRRCQKALVRKPASSKISKIPYLPRSVLFIYFLLNRLLSNYSTLVIIGPILTRRRNRNMTLRIQSLEKHLDSASLPLTTQLFALMISILKNLLDLVLLLYQLHVLPSLVLLLPLLLTHLQHLNLTFTGLLHLLLVLSLGSVILT